MIKENGFSRVFLGVHWVFDAFAIKNNNGSGFGENIGGVPLGLRIAEDIFQGGGGEVPKKSTVGLRVYSIVGSGSLEEAARCLEA
jgi:vanadium chloroperoxidase